MGSGKGGRKEGQSGETGTLASEEEVEMMEGKEEGSLEITPFQKESEERKE